MKTQSVENRARRRLARDGRTLHKVREGTRWYYELGPYYIVSSDMNALVVSGVQIEDLADETWWSQ